MNKSIKMGLGVALLAVVGAGGVFVGEAIAAQPHMEAALESLRTARSELGMAEHNKGGHRAEALRLTEAAIHETEAGIAAGR